MKDLLITPGDAAGVGPEVALKAIQALGGSLPLVCVGPAWLWTASAEALHLPVPGRLQEVPCLGGIEPRAIEYGKVSEVWGRIAMECVRAAAEACMRGSAGAMVTAPVTKEGIHLAGYDCEGHTDFIAGVTNAERHAMMVSAGPLRVVLATVHQALRDVPGALTADGIFDTIELAREAGTKMGIAQPRIAVCGLNPHAGESGAFGDEEEEIILPAIHAAQLNGWAVSGPHPADSVFRAAREGTYDFVIALYHDQGMIPVKLIDPDHGVNLTLGLPIVRTSPAHGSAYDIAGKGVARHGSMVEAITVAARLAGIG